jgi:hypothetical protein
MSPILSFVHESCKVSLDYAQCGAAVDAVHCGFAEKHAGYSATCYNQRALLTELIVEPDLEVWALCDFAGQTVLAKKLEGVVNKRRKSHSALLVHREEFARRICHAAAHRRRPAR